MNAPVTAHNDNSNMREVDSLVGTLIIDLVRAVRRLSESDTEMVSLSEQEPCVAALLLSAAMRSCLTHFGKQ